MKCDRMGPLNPSKQGQYIACFPLFLCQWHTHRGWKPEGQCPVYYFALKEVESSTYTT